MNESKKQFNQAALATAFGVYGVSTMASMAIMNIASGLLAVVILFVLIRSRGNLAVIQKIRPSLGLSALLFLAILLSLFFGSQNPIEYNGKRPVFEFPSDFLKGWYLLLPAFWAVGLSFLTENLRARILQAWVYGFFAICIIAIQQHFTDWPNSMMIPELGNQRFHAMGFFGHHLTFTSVIVFPLFFALECLWNSHLRAHYRIPKGILWIGIVASLIAAFLSYSRMAWVAFPLFIGVWLLWRVSRKAFLRFIAVGAIVVGCVFVFTDAPKRLNLGLGFGARVNLWKINLEFFEKRPVFGIGFRKTHEMSSHYQAEKNPNQTWFFVGHAHNNFLEMLGGTGAFGALAWLWWCVYAIWILFRLGGERWSVRFPLAMICAWGCFHLQGMTQVNFWDSKVTHQVMWIMGWTLFWWVSEKPQTQKG